MKPQLTWISIALVLGTVSPSPAFGQFNGHVTGAPLTATWSETSTKDGKTSHSLIQLARSSSGSTYHASEGPDGWVRIEIDDVPNNRRITFHRIPNDFNHTYQLDIPQGGKFRTDTVEEIRQQLRRAQRMWVEQPDHPKPNGQVHDTSLGERQSDGMTLFGFRSEKTFDTGEKRLTEYWQSDLGIMMSSRDAGPEKGKATSSVLTNLHLGEPDPSLFEIPRDYLAHSDKLLDAKTVFIENETGTQEVLDSAITDFKHFKAVAKERSSADLIVRFTIVPAEDPTFAHNIEMEVYLPNATDSVFRATVGSRGSAAGDNSAARGCMERLWNRILNTHVGQWPPPTTSSGKTPD